MIDPPAPAGASGPARTIVRSAAIAIALAWSLRLIGLASVMVLARVLAPGDFGVVALATSFIALVDIFSALGLRQALLRIPKPDRSHYDTAWTIQLLVLAVLALVLMASAALVARFYGEPALAPIIMILACCFVIDGLGNIGVVDFERHFDFARDMRMRLSVRLATFVLTVSAALILRNYWALVIGMVLQSILHAGASYAFHPYRPRFSLARRKDLLGLSLWMFLASASQTIHTQIEKIVVGRFSSKTVLGFYTVSRDLSSIFTEEIATALNRVTFVTTARTGQPLRDNPGSLLTMMGAYSFIVAPLGFGLSVTAGSLVPILLGSQWSGAVPFLSLIAPSCALYAVNKLIVSTLQASGNAKAAARLSVIGVLLMVAGTVALALLGHGAQDIAAAALAATGMLLVFGIVTLAREAAVPFRAFLAAVARPFIAAAIMMLVLARLDTGGMNDFASLAFEIAAGAPLFLMLAAALWVLHGRPEGAERLAVSLLRQRLRAYRQARLSSGSDREIVSRSRGRS